MIKYNNFTAAGQYRCEIIEILFIFTQKVCM